MTHPLITLLHPSRGRPQKSRDTAAEWIEKAGCNVELIVSIDSSDHSRDLYYSMYSNHWLLNPGHRPKSLIIQNDNRSVVDATNKAAEESTGDILVYLSDDFKCPDNWGQLLIKEFEGETRPCLVKVDDCLQPFHVRVLTIPIMNRALYSHLGYFWHPGYKSMFVDEDLYWTANKLGAMKNCEHLKFPHEHCSIGKAENDETYQRSSANWDQGQAFFAQRKLSGFPL